jgi:hypothetical protein
VQADRRPKCQGAPRRLSYEYRGIRIRRAIIETGDHLGYFHTGDSHRGYMGSGSIDLAGVFRALVTSGYQGPITFESFSSRVVGQPLEGIMGIWRNLWEDSRDLAEHALLYMRAQLKAAREAQKQAERSPLPWPGLAMRRNPNAQEPAPQRERRDKLNRTTLFDDGSGCGT